MTFKLRSLRRRKRYVASGCLMDNSRTERAYVLQSYTVQRCSHPTFTCAKHTVHGNIIICG